MTAALAAAPAELDAAWRERYTSGFRWMLLSRTLEEKIAALYHAGKIVGGVYLGKGQEAFSVALGMTLRKGCDIFAPLIRDQAGRMAFGENILDTVRTYLGSAAGPMRGRDGNIHRGRPREGMPAMISHLGSMISVVCGGLMARRFRGNPQSSVGATCIGDGGTSTGAFHEAMNMASVEKLPLVVAVANNQFAYSTPTDRQFACPDLADRAKAYGVESHVVDATDLAACLNVMDKAISKARSGAGPQMVVGRLLRLCGHGEHDDASYVPAALRNDPSCGDCLATSRRHMLEQDWTTPRDLETMEAEAYETVQAAVAKVQQESAPEVTSETWASLDSGWLTDGRVTDRP